MKGLALPVLALWLLAALPPVHATRIIVVNQDSAGEGFNDTTPAAPVGGNPGTTLGEQRLNVFGQAAKIWESVVDSDVDILVAARFDPLTCNQNQAILGSAGATSAHRNFVNAPVFNTWYPQALANSLAGSDQSGNPDISATFNADIDNNNNCLNNTDWYYGLDGNRPAGTIELLSVVLHELGHGLGFQTFVDLDTGARFNNFDDAFMVHLEDHSLSPPRTWDQLNNSGRLASATATGYLHWIGPQVTAQVGEYSGGINQGHVRMYAPSSVNTGSSVSHFSNTLSPNELMEPFDTGPKSGPGLALPLLADIGWPVAATARPVIAVLADQQVQDDESLPVTVLVQDNDTPAGSLSLAAASSDHAIVAPAGLVFSGSGAQRTLTVMPQTGASGSVTIDVTVSDGNSSASESFLLQVTLNEPPVVSVTSPADNAVFLDTELVSLEGTANDAEDGDLTASMSWLSDRDGLLGAGSGLLVSLSEGAHTLTASATDGLGKTGTAVRSVDVYGNGDSDSDGLPDNWEVAHFGSVAPGGGGDFDGDGLSNQQEYNRGTDPTDTDSDGDDLSDGDEVSLYNLDPAHSDKGDVGPRNAPDGQLNAGDLAVMSRLVTGAVSPSALESALADINRDTRVDAADMLLLERAILQGTSL